MRFMTAGALAAVLAACGGDPTGTNSGDPLDDAEIQALFNALSGAFTDIDTFGGTAAPNAAFVDISEDFSGSSPCPVSGTIAVDGSLNASINDQTFEGSVDYQMSMDLNACVVATEMGNLTVNSDPEVQFTGSFEFAETSTSFEVTEVGGFSFDAADGRRGSCAIDVRVIGEITGTSATQTVTGTVCGRSASEFVVSVS
jgi:hypothetical protein